jgi:predicted SAM-dependent methyltransferase
MKPSLSRKVYLNVGCGGNLIGDFINLDYTWIQNLDVCWDIRKGIPLRSNSLYGIFTEHALEHFEWEDITRTLLPEFLRTLKPGGVLRICVPDAEMAIESYNQAKRVGLVEKPFRDPNPRALTPLMQVTNVFRRLFESYEQGHKFAWDFQTLEFLLDRAGFTEVERASYMSGRVSALLVDYQRRAKESLYVEAIKPKA